MSMPLPLSCRLLVAVFLLTGVFAAGSDEVRGQGRAVGYLEDFALADDRERALEQLVPGSPDYYYYHCLHHQAQGELDEVDELLGIWHERHRNDGRIPIIRNRQLLLAYDVEPDAALRRLRDALGLHYPHQRERPDARPNRPTQLDQDQLTRDAIFARARDHQRRNVAGFDRSAYEWLIQRDLSDDELRDLLSRLDRPDYANLPALVVRDLQYERSRGFGQHDVHRLLTLEQLAACRELMPALMHDTTFIQTWMSKLRPGPDVDIVRNLEARRAYLNRLWNFAEQLAPAHNAIKLHVLHHQLQLDRRLDDYSFDRFLQYVRIPRQAPYVNENWLRDQRRQHGHTADPSADLQDVTLLSRVGNDEPLIRAYLAELFLENDPRDALRQYLREDYLDKLIAETRLTAGLGDAEQWYSLLSPAEVQALRDRVDIDFAATNPQHVEPDELVALAVNVKHVPTLLVRVYRINALNYYQAKNREVGTTIELDGLVPNHASSFAYDAAPIRRVRRSIELPQIDRPGTWVVEMIGNGRSSRAVVRVGQLRYTMEHGPAGHLFRVYDQDNQPLPDATLHVDGHQYTPDDAGRIVVPYTTDPGRQAVILAHGDRATLDHFQHAGEQYRLDAGFHVERESLNDRQQATLLIRPTLRLNGAVQPLGLLEDVRLTITSHDRDGVASSQTVTDFQLDEDGETTHRFQVPPRLASLHFTLDATIPSLSEGEDVDLAASDSVKVNALAGSEKLTIPLLTRDGDDYLLELRGRNGEPLPDRLVTVQVKHRDISSMIHAYLQTDAAGRMRLGPLADVERVSVRTADGLEQAWTLRDPAYTHLPTYTAAAGQTILLPWTRPTDRPTRDALGLLELRDGQPIADRFDRLAIDAGYIVLDALEPGDYQLILKHDDTRIAIHVTEGVAHASHLLGEQRYLDRTDPRPMTLLQPTLDDAGDADDDVIRIRTHHAGPDTRVHVFATRYLAPFHPHDSLRVPAREGATVTRLPFATTSYVAGRDIGDEYRYILDRRHAPRFPGNMLTRPGLLLNPWAVRETDTGQQQPGSGGMFGDSGSDRGRSDAGTAEQEAAPAPREHAPDLNFLANPPLVLANLRPDADGLITLDRDQLGDRHVLHIVAIDGTHTASRQFALDVINPALRERRLIEPLDPDAHFTQRRNTDILHLGDTLTFRDLTDAQLETYDSLADVYRLLLTLNAENDGDGKLADFAFILDWPIFDRDQKLDHYARHASHELHFFLYHKDRPFFDDVVLPYLANKRDKTFMDHYLLGDDLARYRQRWAFAQLNTAERILLGQAQNDQENVARHITDRYHLLPPDTARDNLLFDLALHGSALSTDGIARGFDDFAELDRARRRDQAGGRGGGGLFGSGPVPDDQPARSAPREAAEAMEQLADLAQRGDDNAFERQSKLGVDEAKDMREQVRRLYRVVAPTMEWAENNYHHLPIHQQTADLVPVNAFWRDYAQHDGVGPFLSTEFPEAATNFTSMMLAMAVLDLPFEADEHDLAGDDADNEAPGRVTLTAGSSIIVFYRQIEPVGPPADDAPILVSQNFYQHDDRYRMLDNERVDKFITDEFVVQTVYGGQVVVTNPTSTRQRLDVLLQVPQGAMPVLNGRTTRSHHVAVEPFQTVKLEYHFYFPDPGDYAHFPVHVASRERPVAAAEPVRFHVVAEPTQIDRESWPYISQHGSEEQVVEHLQAHNVEDIDLARIAWRMRDRDFFLTITELLNERLAYDDTLWSYSLLHDHLPTMRQYLQFQDRFVQQAGSYLDSTLLQIDPVERKAWQMLEYAPLVNARAHQLGRVRQIVNPALHSQYLATLDVLAHRAELDDDDRMTVAYYLLLQDRVEEALAFFEQVEPDNLDARLQYDYFTAYLAFYTQELDKARHVAERYADHPVERWRERFATVLSQLAEIEGAGGRLVDEDDRDQQHQRLADTEPAVEMHVEADRIELAWANLDAVTVNYYLMDIELLFSSEPFVQSYGEQFAFIEPNHQQTIDLPDDERATTIALPEQLAGRNLMIEVVGGPVKRSTAYFSNALDVRMVENYGQLQVRHRGEAGGAAGVYVKVYARMADDSVQFYKDGYTDLRGRFDYASVSGDQQGGAQRFSILILSDEHGAVVREAPAPGR
ncbi:MAG: hypothetical protein WD534_14735 [Phycisphaeraceae bacterium]